MGPYVTPLHPLHLSPIPGPIGGRAPHPATSVSFMMRPPIAHATPQHTGGLAAFVCMPCTRPWHKGHGMVEVACGPRQVTWMMWAPQCHPMRLHGSAPPACAPQPPHNQRARSKDKGPTYDPLLTTPMHSGHPAPHARASCTCPVLGHSTHYSSPMAALAPPPMHRPPPCPDCPPFPGPRIHPGHTYMPQAHIYALGTMLMHLGHPQALVTSLVCVIHTTCTSWLPMASSHEPMLPVHTGLHDHVLTGYIDPPLHANAPCCPHAPPSHPDALHPSGDLPHGLPCMSCSRPHPPHAPYFQTASYWPPMAAPMRPALHSPPLCAPRVPLCPRASLRPHTWTTSHSLRDPMPSQHTSTALMPPVAWGS